MREGAERTRVKRAWNTEGAFPGKKASPTEGKHTGPCPCRPVYLSQERGTDSSLSPAKPVLGCTLYVSHTEHTKLILFQV